MAAKFCGSGGAVLIIPGFSYREEAMEALRLYSSAKSLSHRELANNQFVMVKVNMYGHHSVVC